ncbi:unnamed protein product [Rotaria magnacalcarata]|uniref:EF-hand domain-containing protein n=8 Tax=Rotaria magnacalcarata TaxID=392030 RepID=A0A816CH35_9BILA|nr:unnamed protein product [Rotaria magnacalcarata]CAF1621560.1 unnamed protein product [Rotaria magnacalcarata]CAF2012651.1 unnamed protein product [Rotaria magnacalcarata]CAF2045518.1 unnamed protein product [Rotaria magnacalcarata]CAF2118672.1 unnamed protein product [Rotaria magnacalcarata]
MASSVKQVLTHDQLWEVLTDKAVASATPEVVQRYRNYTSPDVSRSRVHPGRAYDPNHRDETHGDQMNLGDGKNGEIINPKPKTNFENRLFNLNELVYERNRHRMQQDTLLPPAIDRYKTTFGLVSKASDRAGDVVNPKKSQAQIEYEFEQPRSMYLFSHKEFEPGEQLERHYQNGELIRKQTHGVPTPVYSDGRHARESLIWVRPNHSTTLVQKDVHEHDESRSDNSAIRTRRFLAQTGLPIDHRFGVTTSSDRLSAGEIIHQRANVPAVFDEKSQAALAKLRSHLCTIHITTFKTQLQAFQYYDTNQDGFISINELTNTIGKNFNLELSNGLIAALMFQCDQDRDEKLNFLEFSNFLCYRIAHSSGLEQFISDEKKKNPNSNRTGIIRDSQGRPLLNISDLVEGTNGKYYPRKLVSQIDEMVPEGWKTSYDKINEAPFRLEPQVKRQYGLPSIATSNQYAIPTSNNKHRPPLGSNTIVGAILSPSIWSDRGLTEDDLLAPKTMEEMRDIFANANIDVSGEDFVSAWTTAAANDQHGQVSVAAFKQALDGNKHSSGNHQLVYA